MSFVNVIFDLCLFDSRTLFQEHNQGIKQGMGVFSVISGAHTKKTCIYFSSVCLSVCPHVTIQEPTNIFLWTLMMSSFKFFLYIPIFVKIGQ
jgi:hypothetical protein